MARLFTAKEGAAILNLMVTDLTGAASTITALDVSSIASVGELVATFPKEDVLNSLTMSFAKTYINSKKRKSKFSIIQETDGTLFENIRREILIYSKGVNEAGDFNTDANTNFAQGFDNGSNSGSSVGTMWEQNVPVTQEMFFGGYTVWDDWLTIFTNQFKMAFNSPAEFLGFLNGILQEKENDIDRSKEAFNRLTFLNHIGMVYDAGAAMPDSKVNLTALYNDEYGTSYTSAELLSEHLDTFLGFMVATIRQYSDNMTDDTTLYHWTPTKTVGGVNYVLNRQTMKEDQRLVLYAPLFNKAKATVLPKIFNPEYLSVEQAEMVNYWQNPNDKMAVSITPAIPDFTGTNNGAQKAGTAVSMSYFVGALFDKDAVKTHYLLNSVDTTPEEARKKYRNTFWHMAKGNVSNATRPCIIFYLED